MAGRHVCWRELLAGRLGRRQLIASSRVSRRAVEIQCLQRLPAGVLDLMLVAMLDEQQRAGAQRMLSALHDGGATTAGHIEPLIRATMPVRRTAFTVPGRNGHLGCLR